MKTSLSLADTGKWYVKTAHSAQVWDLDNMTWYRVPGEGRGQFPYDGVPLPIYHVEIWPALGMPVYVQVDDPENAGIYLWRISTAVTSIEEYREEGN